MKRSLFVLTFIVAAAWTASAADPPAWAYGFATPLSSAPPPAAGGRGGSGGGRGGSGRGPQAPAPMLHLEGSTLEFPANRVNDGFNPVDWFPDQHPQMPEVVAHGRRPDIRACALCHGPVGQGRSENAGVNGLPVEYFIQQLRDFAAGNRKSTDTRKANTNAMALIGKTMTEDELKAAAEYYAAVPFKFLVTVKESATAPKTRINNGLFLALEGSETEPLGDRIIEVPVNAELTEGYRDPRSGYIAYVPVGSLKKGEALAKTGQCALCHGADLKGIGPVPPIAGHSPSYMMRQMYDMQQGNRKGLWTGLMKPVVAPLSQNDMLDLVAYAASRTP
jgi:cytochrome c553